MESLITHRDQCYMEELLSDLADHGEIPQVISALNRLKPLLPRKLATQPHRATRCRQDLSTVGRIAVMIAEMSSGSAEARAASALLDTVTMLNPSTDALLSAEAIIASLESRESLRWKLAEFSETMRLIRDPAVRNLLIELSMLAVPDTTADRIAVIDHLAAVARLVRR